VAGLLVWLTGGEGEILSEVQVRIYNSPTEFERDAAEMMGDGWVVADVNRRVSRGAVGRVRLSAFPNRKAGDRGGGRGGRMIVTYTLGTPDQAEDADDAEEFDSSTSRVG